MKMMFQTVADTSKAMVEALEKSVDGTPTVDIKEVVSCYATDVIGSCAFGINCNSFKDPNAEFRKMGREIFVPHFETNLRGFFALIFPKFCKLIGEYLCFQNKIILISIKNLKISTSFFQG